MNISTLKAKINAKRDTLKDSEHIPVGLQLIVDLLAIVEDQQKESEALERKVRTLEANSSKTGEYIFMTACTVGGFIVGVIAVNQAWPTGLNGFSWLAGGAFGLWLGLCISEPRH